MPERGTSAASLLERAHANYLELFRAMARVSPQGAVEEEGGVLLVRTGRPLPMLNLAAVSLVPSDPTAVLERARAFFAPHGLRFMLNTVGGAAEAMAPVAEAAGMMHDSSPIMVLTPLDGTPRAVPGLTVEVVQDAAMFRIYNDTMTAGFGGQWVAPEILDDPALLSVPDMIHYVGYLDGRPVATAALLSSHRIAGVFNVSTIPAYRRRGIGEAMTWRAALDGRAGGCIAGALQATEMGFPVYERMGYRQVATYEGWLSPTEGIGSRE